MSYEGDGGLGVFDFRANEMMDGLVARLVKKDIADRKRGASAQAGTIIANNTGRCAFEQSGEEGAEAEDLLFPVVHEAVDEGVAEAAAGSRASGSYGKNVRLGDERAGKGAASVGQFVSGSFEGGFGDARAFHDVKRGLLPEVFESTALEKQCEF